MKTASLLILMLSNQGYWFGGQESTVSIRWAAKGQFPDTVMAWNLMFGDVRVAGERITIKSGEKPSIITITPPPVRIRTSLRLVYRLETKTGGKILAEGVEGIYVFPNNILNGLARRLGNKKIMVLDNTNQLPDFLDKVKISFSRISKLSQLQFARSDMFLIGMDQIDEPIFNQELLVEQTRSGSSIFIFQQTRSKVLLEYPLFRRKIPLRLEWRMEHPLFNQFQLKDMQSWLQGPEDELWALELPPDEPVLEIAWWPREIPGKTLIFTDALLAVKSIDQGRIVFCQIPLGNWRNDPRTQLFLANTFDYLMTRPEPTLRPSQRQIEKDKKVKTFSNVIY